ncbi:hypothetical protein ABEB36_010622 [Hypothenemus hampei]|uniref:F-box domain-containing protein n=1 Tax=Hypothenemus hampei TaxID=57062 RepID=A0ABD1EFB4_HYPHA
MTQMSSFQESIDSKTGSIYNAPHFPKYVVNSHSMWQSNVLVRPLGTFHEQKPYKYQENPFNAEYLFTFNTIRIEFNKNFLMHSRAIETLIPRCQLMAMPNFPLVLPLDDKILYEGVQALIRNVVPKRELETNWNGKNFTEYLPIEILYNIFDHLDLRSLSRCAQVNKRWNSVASDLHFYQEVDLKMFWDKINGKNLRKLKNKLQIVKKLDMTWCNDSTLIRRNEYFNTLISILEAAKDTLTHLCLNYTNRISEEAFEQIFECPNLEELRLQNIRLNKLHNSCLEYCKELTSLKTLDVSLSTIEGSGLIEILKKTPNLEHLLMNDCYQLGYFNPIITTVVKYNPKLKSWASTLTFFLDDNSQAYEKFGKLIYLECLDMTGCEPQPYGSSWLKCIAVNCKKLRRLELGRWKYLGDEDLMPVLTQCKELSHLYLPYTSRITYWTLSLACKNLPNLRHICVYSCKKISKKVIEELAESYKHVNIYQIK